MIIRKLSKCEEFTTSDGSFFKELYNSNKENWKINHSLGQARVKSGQTTQLHTLKAVEIYYITQGKGLMFVDDEQKEVEAGDAIIILENSKQKIKNIGDEDLLFLCIVEPSWKPEIDTNLEDI